MNPLANRYFALASTLAALKPKTARPLSSASPKISPWNAPALFQKRKSTWFDEPRISNRSDPLNWVMKLAVLAALFALTFAVFPVLWKRKIPSLPPKLVEQTNGFWIDAETESDGATIVPVKVPPASVKNAVQYAGWVVGFLADVLGPLACSARYSLPLLPRATAPIA